MKKVYFVCYDKYTQKYIKTVEVHNNSYWGWNVDLDRELWELCLTKKEADELVEKLKGGIKNV